MKKTSHQIFMGIVMILLFVTGCSAAASDAPAASVQAYWQAMADKEASALSNLTCADFEATALSTLDSFQAVETTLSNLKCTTVFEDGKTAEVTCQGTLDATYGAEVSNFDLSVYTFLVIKQGDDWLMCGEK